MRYGNTKRKHDPIEVESDPEDLKTAAAHLDKLFAVPRAPKEEKIPLASRPPHLPGVVYCKHCDLAIKPEYAYAPTNPKSKVPLCKWPDCKQSRKSVEDSLLRNEDIDKEEAAITMIEEGDAAADAKRIVENFKNPQAFAPDFAGTREKKVPEFLEQKDDKKKDEDETEKEIAEQIEQHFEDDIMPSRVPIQRRLSDDDQVVEAIKSDHDRARDLLARSDLADIRDVPFWHHERSLREGPLRPRREPAESAVPVKPVPIDELKLLGLAAKALVKKRRQKEELAKRRKIDERVRLDKVLKKANHSLRGLYRLTPRQLVKLLKKLKPSPLTSQEEAFYRDYAASKESEKPLAALSAQDEQAIIVAENRIIARAIDTGCLEELIPGEAGGGIAEPADNDHKHELDLIRQTGGSTLGGQIHGGRLPDRVPGSRKGVGHYKLEDFRTAPTSMGRGGKASVDSGGPDHDDFGEESTPD